MSKKVLLILLALIVAVPLLFLLIGQAYFPSFAIFGEDREVVAADLAAEEATAVVEEFYRWYLAYPGNPFAERAYRDSPLVTPAFIAAMDEAFEAMRAAGPGGADLLICAQDVPGDMRYGPAEVSGDMATVTVLQIWNPGTEFELTHDLIVQVQRVDGEWLIGDIICQVP